MRKFTRMIALLIGMMLLNTANLYADDSQHAIGYCSNSIAFGAGLGNITNLKGAIYLTPAKLSKYKDQKISALRIGFYSNPGDECKVFITKDLNKTPIMEQDVSGLDEGWNYISLDNGVTIDGSGLYVGFSSKSGLYSLGLDNNVATSDDGNWISIHEGKWIHASTNSSWTGVMCIEALISGGDYSTDKPQCKLMVDNVINEYLTSPDSLIRYRAYITNLGTATITDFDLTYTIDEGESVKKHISGLNLKNRQSMFLDEYFDEKMPEGQHTLTTYIVNINGTGTAKGTNTIHTNKINSVSGDYFKPNALFELFTTEQCSQCPRAHKAYHEYFKGRNDIVEVANHVGFYEDPVTAEDSRWFLNFYGGSSFAPGMMVNRLLFEDATVPVMVTYGPSIDYAMQQVLSAPAKVRTYAKLKYDADKRQLTVSAVAEKKSDFDTSTTQQLNLFITEDSIYTTGMQAGAGAHYRHDNALRKVIARNGDVYGDAVSWNGNIAQGREYTYSVPETFNINQLKVVTFINDNGDYDYSKYRVYNSNVQRIADEVNVIPSGIDSNLSENSNISYVPQQDVLQLSANFIWKEILHI
jgi:hypothetical protein